VVNTYKVLFLGASYGSLLATKMALAGHETTMVCLPAEVEAFNRDGAIVRFPVRGRDGLVEVRSGDLPGSVTAASPADVDPADFDLICLAMQEPQYRFDDVKALLKRVGASGKPSMSIMNMPPLAYMRRIDSIDHRAIEQCYADADVWSSIDPSMITLCSPDPQAFRPPEEPVNVLQVTLPTNFKAARFESDEHTAMLRDIQQSIEAVRYTTADGEALELPVKLKVHESKFVPLAKWSMLLTGNYRCIGEDDARAIKDSVHTDLDASREVYAFVGKLCVAMGANPADMVPFEKYANAAFGLLKPSSAARALYAGAPFIERVDCLVRTIAQAYGMQSDSVDATVKIVDKRLASNRAAAK